MIIFEEIKAAIKQKRYNITNHADEEMVKDKLKLAQVLSSVITGKVIEDYPHDFPHPSCLIYGQRRFIPCGVLMIMKKQL